MRAHETADDEFGNKASGKIKCLQFAYRRQEFEASVPCAVCGVVHASDDFILVKEIF